MRLLSLAILLLPGCDLLGISFDDPSAEDGSDDGTDVDDSPGDDNSDDNSDEDNDGLTAEEESDLGTDPDEADSDGDGMDDGDEVEAGTNPAYEWSVPLEYGDYLIGDCPNPPDEENAGWSGEYSLVYNGQTYEWEGYDEGDTVVNLVGEDSFGQIVSTYSFCGNYTLVSVGAMWCGPCIDLAKEAAELQESVREDYPKFQLIDLVTQDEYGDLTNVKDLEDWYDAGSLEGVVVMGGDPELSDNDNALNFQAWDADGYIPSLILLSPSMEVIDMDGDLMTAKDITRAIEKYEEDN